MENPYQNLVIYYFEGRIEPGGAVTADPRFLGNWQEADSAFVFFSEPVPFFAKQMADQYPGACLADVYEMTWEQWNGDRIRSYCLEKFYVYPPWEKPADDPDRRHIILDPGVVFGTGLQHSQTRKVVETLTKKQVHILQHRCPDGIWNTLLVKLSMAGSCGVH